MAAGMWGSWAPCVTNQEAERDKCQGSAHVLFIQLETPVHRGASYSQSGSSHLTQSRNYLTVMPRSFQVCLLGYSRCCQSRLTITTTDPLLMAEADLCYGTLLLDPGLTEPSPIITNPLWGLSQGKWAAWCAPKWSRHNSCAARSSPIFHQQRTYKWVIALAWGLHQHEVGSVADRVAPEHGETKEQDNHSQA